MIPFHKLLIGTGIAFCAAFALWALARWGASGGTGMLILGLAFGAAALGLSYYLRNLKRFLGR